MPKLSPDERNSLIARLSAVLERCLEGASPTESDESSESPAEAEERADAERLAYARRLLDGKLTWELRSDCATPWLVMMAGGTNVGKSEIFNALAGGAFALPDARSAQTKHVLAFVHSDDTASLRAMLEPRWEFLPLADPAALNARDAAEARRIYLSEHAHAALAGFCLFDTPDIDSDLAANREKALELSAACDALVYVTVAEKYNDRICVEFLGRALREVRRPRLVFNLATPDNRDARRDLRDRVLPGALEAARSARAERAAAALEAASEAAPEAARDAPTVLEVPAAYNAATRSDEIAANVDPLRQELLADAAGRLEHKRRLVRSLGGIVAESLEAAIARQELQLAWHDALAERFGEQATQAGERLRAFYADCRFHELDQIFDRVARSLEIPYLDRALEWTGDMAMKFGRLIGLARESSPRAQWQRARRDGEEAWSDRALEEAQELIEREIDAQKAHPMARRAKALLPRLDALAPASLIADGKEERVELDLFLEETEVELQRRIDARPGLRRAIMAGRATIIAVGGLSGAVLTFGLGRIDLLIAPASAAVVRKIIEQIGRQWLEQRKSAYFDLKVRAGAARLDAYHAAVLQALRPRFAREQLAEYRATLKAFQGLLPASRPR